MRERRENRRRSFSLIRLGLLVIVIFCGLFFPEIPNINTYINSNNEHHLLITKVKIAGDAPIKYRHNHPEGVVISQTIKRTDTVHAYVSKDGVIQMHLPSKSATDSHSKINTRYIQVGVGEEDNAPDFAKSMDNAAIYTANLMHKYHLKPDATSYNNRTLYSLNDLVHSKNSTNLDDYFGRFGYSSVQFYNLVSQYYYNKAITAPFGLPIFERIIMVLKIFGIIGGIVLIIISIFLPSTFWKRWWQ